LRSWSEALRPYLNLDDALLAAGWAPSDPAMVRAFRSIARRWGELEQRVGEWVTEETDQDSDEEAGGDSGGNKR
jgi:hypothetical protein